MSNKKHQTQQWVAKPRFGREGVRILYSDTYDNRQDFGTSADTWSPNGRLKIGNFKSQDDRDPLDTLNDSANHFLETLSKALKEAAGTRAKVKSVLDRQWGSQYAPNDIIMEDFGYKIGANIFQQYFAPVELMGRTARTSSWIVKGVPVAVCFREDTAQTTNDDSSFISQYLSGMSSFFFEKDGKVPLVQNATKAPRTALRLESNWAEQGHPEQ